MNNIVIYGTTDFSKELHYYVEADQQGKVLAFVLDRQYIKEDEFDGLPVIPYDELEAHYEKDDIEILVSLGYSKMNDNRKAIFDKCMSDGWKIASFIHSSAKILPGHIGMGNIILDNADIRLHASIGDGNIILARTLIAHDSCVGNFNYFAGSNQVGGRAKIGDFNFLGMGAILASNCTMMNYNLIGVGVCLNRNIESETLVGEAPLRLKHINKRVMDTFLMKK